MTTSIPLWADGEPFERPSTIPANRPWAQEEDSRLDLYLLHETNQPTPLVIICPGGGYHNRARHEGHDVAEWLNSCGLHAAVLHYHVDPWHDPVQLACAHRAIRLVRHHATEWQVDLTRIGMCGFSAGGHLAGSALCHTLPADPAAVDPIDRHSTELQAGILAYAVLDLGVYRHEGSRRGLLGEERDPVREQHFSLHRQVHKAVPPCFIWHTADDKAVPVQNSLFFAQACAQHGVPAELHVFPHGAHGIGLANLPGKENPHCAQWAKLAENWLKELDWLLPT